MKLRYRIALLLALVVAAGTADAQIQTFANPTHAGYAIDYCGNDPRTCGEAVATAWCRSKDFDFATEWSAAPQSAATEAVRLEDATICRGAECQAFASITCGRQQERQKAQMPRLGALGRATVLVPGQRGQAIEYERVAVGSMVPGCTQRESGVFLCETQHDYQHCRSLMSLGQVFSCRAGLAFDGNFAKPVAPAAGEYTLNVDSNAVIRVEKGNRGDAKVKGEAKIEVTFAVPKVGASSWCLQRDRYVYFPTGPKGGIGEVDDTADCDTPIRTSVAPNEDDVLVAYDLCNTFAAWGSELEHTTDVLVGGLFSISSASPEFTARNHGAPEVIAPYLTVKAPVTIECHD